MKEINRYVVGTGEDDFPMEKSKLDTYIEKCKFFFTCGNDGMVAVQTKRGMVCAFTGDTVIEFEDGSLDVLKKGQKDE